MILKEKHYYIVEKNKEKQGKLKTIWPKHIIKVIKPSSSSKPSPTKFRMAMKHNAPWKILTKICSRLSTKHQTSKPLPSNCPETMERRQACFKS